MLTCTACRLMFQSNDQQKEHFRLDWHRYNLKRKVVELPPITLEQFNARMTSITQDKPLKHTNKQQIKESTLKFKCQCCNKVFTTKNAYENHLASKKHIQKAKQYQAPHVNTKVNSTISIPIEIHTIEEKLQDLQVHEDKILSLEDYKKSLPLELEDCIFCTMKSSDFDTNLHHMLKQHGFFIPDIDYLVDIQGLVMYLAEKVKIGHYCLYCNGKGKTFDKYQDVQKHMISLSHCKLKYQEQEDVEEFIDFYDFSSQYTKDELKEVMENNTNEDIEWETCSEESINSDEEIENEEDEEDEEDDNIEDNYNIGVSETGELVLKDGKRLGRREFRRYYKQRFRPEESRASVLAATKERLLLAYNAAGIDPQSSSTALSTTFIASFMKKRNNISGGMSIREVKTRNHAREKHRERLDKRSHKLQKNPNRRILVTV